MHCYKRAIDVVPLVETATGSFIAGWDDNETYAIAEGERWRARAENK
jgi:hypothetical protein